MGSMITTHRLTDSSNTVYWEAGTTKPSDDVKHNPKRPVLVKTWKPGASKANWIHIGTEEEELSFTFKWNHSTLTTDLGYLLAWYEHSADGTYTLTYTSDYSTEIHSGGVTVEITSLTVTELGSYSERTYQIAITLQKV